MQSIPVQSELPFGMGYVPDPVDHRATPLRRLLGAPAFLPHNASCRIWMPDFRFQGSTQSCVGHALRAAISASLSQQAQPLDFDPAPVGIYDLARCIDRIPYENGDLPPLEDTGCQPNEAVRGLQEWGLCPYDVRPTAKITINQEPSFLELEMSTTCHIFGAYKATGSLSCIRQQVQEAIALLQTPVCVAMPVDPAIIDWDPSEGPHGAVDPDNIKGWHYVCVCGYDTMQTGEVIWDYANSWAGWGIEGGYGMGGEGWSNGWRDVMVCKARRMP